MTVNMLLIILETLNFLTVLKMQIGLKAQNVMKIIVELKTNIAERVSINEFIDLNTGLEQRNFIGGQVLMNHYLLRE